MLLSFKRSSAISNGYYCGLCVGSLHSFQVMLLHQCGTVTCLKLPLFETSFWVLLIVVDYETFYSARNVGRHLVHKRSGLISVPL